ncbi:unnamed protein product, partial [Mesorhabditis spiculigera]
MDAQARLQVLRCVAYSTVAFATLSVLTVAMTVPMMYAYVDQIKIQMDQEMDACREAGEEISMGVSELRAIQALSRSNRTARQAYQDLDAALLPHTPQRPSYGANRGGWGANRQGGQYAQARQGQGYNRQPAAVGGYQNQNGYNRGGNTGAQNGYNRNGGFGGNSGAGNGHTVLEVLTRPVRMFFDFGLSENLHKRWCRYIIHRYLGQFLDLKLSLEDISVSLIEGEINVGDLYLSTKVINEILESQGLPFRLVEGYIGNINLKVPWSSLTKEPTKASVSNLQLTFKALDQFSVEDADQVSTMLGSVLESFSQDLAEDFCKEENVKQEELEDGTDGVKAFSQVIDAIVSRFCVKFNDTTVRIERAPEEMSAYGMALEMLIEEFEFMDDQMKNVNRGQGTSEAITSQPQAACSVTKLHKFLSVRGLSLFTDVFTPIDNHFSDGDELYSSQCLTSMHVRRTNKQKDDSLNDSNGLLESTASGLGDYQSCYSTLTTSTRRPAAYPQTSQNPEECENLESSPIRFARLSDDTEITIEFDNPVGQSKDQRRKLNIALNASSLNAFLSPSQIAILQKFFSNIAIDPKKKKSQNYGSTVTDHDLENIVRQTVEGNHIGGNRLGDETYPGQEFKEFSQISLDDSPKPMQEVKSRIPRKEFIKSDRNDANTVMNLKLRSANIFVTHDDPMDKINSTEGIKKLDDLSNEFFEKIQKLNFIAPSATQELLETTRNQLNTAYAGDHLRCNACGVTVAMNSTNGSDDIKIAAQTFDLIESLSAESCEGSSERMHIPLISFARETDEQRSNENIVIDVIKRASQDTTNISIHMGHIITEADISIIDRISALITPQPFFFEASYGMAKTRQRFMSRLSTNLPCDEYDEKTPSKFLIEFTCADWTIDLKFPVINRTEQRTDHRIRHLHKETLRIRFVKPLATLPYENSKNINLEFQADKFNAWFMGNQELLQCTEKDFCFVHGDKKFGDETERIKISVTYDPRNKSLHDADFTSGGRPVDLEKSFTSALLGAVEQREGLFSQTFSAYTRGDKNWENGAQSSSILDDIDEENEPVSYDTMCNIIRPGTRKQMINWSNDCNQKARALIAISAPTLQAHIPSHKFLELLYNRLVNDLPLWLPSSPRLSRSDSHSTETFKNFRSTGLEEDDDTESDIHEPVEDIDRSKNHLFALSFSSNKTTFVLGTVATENRRNVEGGKAQVIAHMDSPALYLLYGFHGNPLLTYFYFTTTAVTLAHNKNANSPNDVAERDFGKHSRADTVVERINDQTLANLNSEDCIGIAVKLNLRNRDDVKDTMLTVSTRQLQMNLHPFRDAGHLWATQVSALFTLTDYHIPGYEMPKVQTEFHLNLDEVVLAYDHSDITKDSPLKLRLGLGQADLYCGSLQSDCSLELLCLFERTRVFMTNQTVKKNARFAGDAEKVQSNGFFQIVALEMFQLEVRLGAPSQTSQRIPQFDVRCTNDMLKIWLCEDSLVTLINMAGEFSESDAIKPIPMNEEEVEAEEEEERNTVIDEGRSEAGESTWSRPSSNKPKDIPLPTEKAQQLEKMMASAMEEDLDGGNVGIPVGREALDTLFEDAVGSWDSKPHNGHRQRVESENYHTRHTSISTDDEFCMVDDIIGAGIVGSSGEPRIRALIPGQSAEDTGISPEREYFSQAGENRAQGVLATPPNYPLPICRCHLKDVSVEVHLFGGNDLGEHWNGPRAYSMLEYRDGQGRGQSLKKEEKGGPHRDHSVAVVLTLSKIQLLHQLFDARAPMMGMTLATIQDITVKDRLKTSDINEMVYQYFTIERPRRTLAPMLAIRIAESHKCEGKLRVSLLPVRVNIDQFTLDFLEEFSLSVSKGIRLPSNMGLPEKKQPVIEVPCRPPGEQNGGRLYPTLSKEPLTPSPIGPNPYADLSPLEEVTNGFQGRRPINMDPIMTDSMAFCHDRTPQREEPPPFVFSALSETLPTGSDDEEDPNIIGDSGDMLGDWAAQSVSENNQGQGPLLRSFSQPTPVQHRQSVDDILMRSTMDGSIQPLYDDNDEADSSGENLLELSDQVGSSHDLNQDEPADDMTTQVDEPAPEPQKLTTYFKEFVFSPAATFYIDYQGKKINYEKDGAMLGALKGLVKLNRTEIVLKELHCRNGLLGFDRCIQYAIDEWSEDIVKHFPNVLASCGPISPLVDISRGFYDLFWMPVNEMRKEDGRLVKGIQRGAGSFGTSTAAAVVELAQTFVGAVQYATETVFHEVHPGEAHITGRSQKAIASSQAAPADLRQATQRAYDIVRDGVRQTREDLEHASQENRASGQSAIRSWARFATPTVLRPFMMTAQVTYQMLGGLRNQLRPDVYMEDIHKWKDAEPGTSRN